MYTPTSHWPKQIKFAQAISKQYMSPKTENTKKQTQSERKPKDGCPRGDFNRMHILFVLLSITTKQN